MSLITVKDLSKAKALEVTAGGKLYNIIVDTEVCLCPGFSWARVNSLPSSWYSAVVLDLV